MHFQSDSQLRNDLDREVRRHRTHRRLRPWHGVMFAAAVTIGATVPVVAGTSPAVAASVSGVVNTYQSVSAVAGATVTVAGSARGAVTPFAVGDRVMLIQMTGLSPAVAGSNMGNYDTATILAISGSDITLSAVTHSYSPSAEAVQLVRIVHDATTVTVAGVITAAPWDGATGGVIALSGGALDLASDIDASASGFSVTHGPTGDVTPNLSSGPGAVAGRGSDGSATVSGISFAGLGGGGIGGGGGGGVGSSVDDGRGGGQAGGGVSGEGAAAPGTSGGAAAITAGYGGALGAAGGGGGVIGGGGGGGASDRAYLTSPPGASGGGGGTDGGGSGGAVATTETLRLTAAGGGGTLGVGSGGHGLIGGPSGSDPLNSANEGSAGGGGGSYGGGGGAPSNVAGGDDSAGGGGGGSWTGGGSGGSGGVAVSGMPYPKGGDGNAAVADPLPDSAHFLNLANPRLMMGGAGGRGSQEAGFTGGGVGGGIVFLDFDTIRGLGQIRSDGGPGLSPAGGGAHSGSGGGAGGQMRIRANTLEDPLVLAANGGLGGAPTANLYHAGVSGGGGGAGGIWVELVDAEPSCPAADQPNLIFELAGGNGGPSITNPKNNMPSGVGGAGGRGLGCVSPKQPLIGSIELSKVIIDPSPEDELGDAGSFPVQIACTAPDAPDAIVRDVVVPRDGTPTVVDELPAGSVCGITETDTDGGVATFVPEGPVTVGDGTVFSVVITNTFPQAPPTTTTAPTTTAAPTTTTTPTEPTTEPTTAPTQPATATTDAALPALPTPAPTTTAPVGDLPVTGATMTPRTTVVGALALTLGALALLITRRRRVQH